MSHPSVEYHDLVSSLDSEWLRLPYAAMREVGAAVQTLGGLLRITTDETFVRVDKIAVSAGLPIDTVRKHLTTLRCAGWIESLGRQRTANGRPRRTITWRPARKAEHEPYGILPLWASGSIGQGTKLSWSDRAVLSVVMAGLCKCKAAFERTDHNFPTVEDFMNNFGMESRFSSPLSLSGLESLTGLARNSIIKARENLMRLGIIGAAVDCGIADLLLPNFEFRVVVTPTDGGRAIVNFESSLDEGVA